MADFVDSEAEESSGSDSEVETTRKKNVISDDSDEEGNVPICQ